jgi:hypothetical protein
MNKLILLLVLIILFTGCESTDRKELNTKKSYFDLQGYFTKEKLRLASKKPLVNKTVSVNGSSECKLIRMSDWKKELSAFTDADINKSSWEGLFQTSKSVRYEVYSSNDEKVPVKKVEVFKKNGVVKGLKILVINANTLYTSVDTLSYYPDSLYQIIKKQDIRFLSTKEYKITGRF